MSSRHLLKILLAASAIFSFSTVSANVITSGCTLDPNRACTLAELVSDPLAYIQIDGTRFNNFSELSISFADQSRIRVEAVDSAGGGNQGGSTVGLKFIPVDGLSSLLEAFSLDDYYAFREIAYDVTVNSGLPIGASNLKAKFGNYVFSSGLALDGGLSTTIYRGSLSSVSMFATCNQLNPTCENKTAFTNQAFGPVYSLSISDGLFIDHEGIFGGRPDGMQILSFEQDFTRTVPEPGILGLVVISLAGLGFGRRKS